MFLQHNDFALIRSFLNPALGQEMIKSKKTRRDIIDGGWNRFMFDDKDSELPDWFVKEEQFHMRCHPEVDPNVVDFYKNRQKDVNVKTIKKVVEAKARKKRKLTKRMDKAKKRASNILENEDLGMYIQLVLLRIVPWDFFFFFELLNF